MCLSPSISQLHRHPSTLGHIQALVKHPQLTSNFLDEVQVIQRFPKPHKGIQPFYFFGCFVCLHTFNRLEHEPILLMIPVLYVCYKASLNA